MNDDRPCIVMTALGSEEAAETIAVAIVEARLAACVQIHPVRSFYIWQGRLQRDAEWVLCAKTLGTHYTRLEALIRERHGYELPEVLRLPVEGGSEDYLRWLRMED